MQIRRLARCLISGAGTAVLVLATSGIAYAQYPGGNNTPPPTVGGEHFHRGTHLTKTGADVLMYVAIALVALLAGLALRRFARSRAAQSGN